MNAVALKAIESKVNVESLRSRRRTSQSPQFPAKYRSVACGYLRQQWADSEAHEQIRNVIDV